MAALSFPALRQAVAKVTPSRLPEFFQGFPDAFTQAGDEDSVFPLRHFYSRWGAHRHRAGVGEFCAVLDPDDQVGTDEVGQTAAL